jgi:hypothetical protein
VRDSNPTPDIFLFVLEKSESLNQGSACFLLHADFLLGLLLEIKEESDILPKRQLTFTGLHVVISQKTNSLKFILFKEIYF